MTNSAVFWLVAGALLGFSAGAWTFSLSFRFRRRSKPPDQGPQAEIYVKRTRPSFRNPGKTTVSRNEPYRTSTAAYDQYKSENGLFAPRRPGNVTTSDEVERK